MTTRTVVCPECGAEVPSGRLSCAACGTLLASVAGAVRRPLAFDRPAAGGSGAATQVDAVDAAASSSRSSRNASARASRADRPVRPIPPVLHDWVGPLPATVAASTAAASAAPAPATSGRRASAGAVARRRGPRPAEVVPDAATEIVPTPPVQVLPAAGTPEFEPYASSDAEPYSGSDLDLPFDEDAPLGSAIPGAWVAPTVAPRGFPAVVPTAEATSGGRPATATSIAAVGIVDGTVASVGATPRPDRWFSVPAAAPASAPAEDAASTPGKAGLFSDLPFRSPTSLAGWAVAIGALLGAVSFVLPWAGVGVIGTQFDPTYTGLWGLANPAQLVPMGVAIALLLMTVLPNRIPSWVRGVILPILIGGWFLGIAWTYASGPFGLGWGVDALAIGGIVLVIGGAWSLRRPDEAPADTSASQDPA